MIRRAKETDLPAVAAIYEAILDQEDATGAHYTGWQRGAYPTADTARSIFEARGWPAKWWSLPRTLPAARAKPFCGWIPGWTTIPPTTSTPLLATGLPAW